MSTIFLYFVALIISYFIGGILGRITQNLLNAFKASEYVKRLLCGFVLGSTTAIASIYVLNWFGKPIHWGFYVVLIGTLITLTLYNYYRVRSAIETHKSDRIVSANLNYLMQARLVQDLTATVTALICSILLLGNDIPKITPTFISSTPIPKLSPTIMYSQAVVATLSPVPITSTAGLSLTVTDAQALAATSTAAPSTSTARLSPTVKVKQTIIASLTSIPSTVNSPLVKSSSDCTKDFYTFHNYNQLNLLRGKKLVLITFDYEQDMLVGDTADQSTGIKIANELKKNFITSLTPHFSVVDVTSEGYDIKKGLLAITDTASIQRIINNNDANGAIIVTNSYGYELSWGDSITEGIAGDIVQNVLETVVSKKAADWFQSLSGGSYVLSYNLVSDTSITNQNGEVIWRFCGKASALTSPLSNTASENLEEFTRSISGTDPTENEQTRVMEKIYKSYIEYLAWILDSDFKGLSSINYYTDYPAYDRKSLITIFPALDSTHAPFVRTAEEIKKLRKESENGLLSIARSAKWGKFGEWQHAWASLKLLGIALIIGIPISYIDDKFRKKSKEKEGEGCLTIQLILFAIGIYMLASIYYLLKAIF